MKRNKAKDRYLEDLSKSKCDEKIFEFFTIKKLKEYFNYQKDYCLIYPIDFITPILIPVLQTELIDYFEIHILDEVNKSNILFNDINQMFNKLNIQNIRYPKISIHLSFKST